VTNECGGGRPRLLRSAALRFPFLCCHVLRFNILVVPRCVLVFGGIFPSLLSRCHGHLFREFRLFPHVFCVLSSGRAFHRFP
jgi:hypothetical protein